MQQNRNLKIVLINPPQANILNSATPSYVSKNHGKLPPLGILYVQAAIEKSKHASIFIDADLEEFSCEETARQALSHNPDIIGMHVNTFVLRDAYYLAKKIKEINPNVKILVGGPHAAIYPNETVSLGMFDFVMAGEVGAEVIHFLDNYHDSKQWSVIPGLAFIENKRIVYTPCEGYQEDIDSIPFPARRASKVKRYSLVITGRNPVTTMITSRGCPFNCIFCNRMGRHYRYHSVDYVLDEFEQIVSLGIKEVFIVDDVFTYKKDRIMQICERLISRNYDLTWQGRTRVDCVDREMLELMFRAGCRRLSFGIESGSKKVLKSMNKDVDLEKAKEVFRYCKEYGIETLADFMIGNLDENIEDINKSKKLAKELDPDYIQWSILTAYPNTPIYNIGLETGIFDHDIWRDFARNPQGEYNIPVWTQNFTEEQLYKMTASAYRDFYFRPSFMLKQLRKIKTFSQFVKMVQSALGMVLN